MTMLCRTALLLPLLGCVSLPCSEAFIATTPFSRLKSSPEITTLKANKNNKNNLSAAARERREAEKRQKERKHDVVIGKTSAIPYAKNYQLDPSFTEQEYLRQASKNERVVFQETERGLQSLKGLDIEQANQAFDTVFQLKPNAYLWQAGIAKFYLDMVEQATDIFSRSAEFYEGQFGMVASEERIWHRACLLKLRKEGKQVPPDENEDDHDDEELMPETRKVLRIANDLFAASLTDDYSTIFLSRAKLRSICGTGSGRQDFKMWKVMSWFYLGLHYDVLGEVEESKECIKAALTTCPSMGNGDDIIHTLPVLHMAKRDWYDEDDFEPNSSTEMERGGDEDSHGSTTSQQQTQGKGFDSSSMRTSPVVINSIRSSVEKLKCAQIQEALRTRGLKGYGSKKELQEKLFQSLLQDAGLD